MANVVGKGRPKGFRLMPEGEQNLKITKVVGLPRANVTNVEVDFVNEDGITLKNKYDLTSDGGYAAFYFLVLNGMGIDLDEGDQFDIDQLDGQFVSVEIVHKEGTKPREDGTVAIFANIKATLGKGVPFGDATDGATAPAEEWD
jgi:hypothetical protein